MENQEEIWKDIVGYEGLYMVSNLGRVRSFAKLKRLNDGTILGEPRILKQALTNYGYKQVCLYINNTTTPFTIHKLVAIAFLNHKPNGHELIVDHIDGNKTNNKLQNLNIISQRENVAKGRCAKIGSSKHIGVSWNKRSRKWLSYIYVGNKRIDLGFFKSEIEASNAYKNKLNTINNTNQL